ncbi:MULTISPECIES: SusC/RagA family TonB-linked outer membrane protein [Sphingobacterium]|uniref:SusC/RagA family TonB-linked outer membrane protein n=1 Tax=Sphingobacterium TaxID=28453 RepID=UPI001917E295|nr:MULTISPECIES: SusC/RagA family TonB-linked outer membrane protein [Sphingobacterium]QQT24278.1 SusC/RagA family TonB-linked outer membrane protein [Sphingobacterium spiritivorum]
MNIFLSKKHQMLTMLLLRFKSPRINCPLRLGILGALCVSSQVVLAQSAASVHGVVRDSENNPITGATVVIENPTTKYKQVNTTNTEGIFSFDRIPEGQGYVITVSYLGFKTKTLSNYNIDSKDKVAITVALEQDQASLEEVVVVGYGKQRKANITGSVASVNAEQLKNIAPSNLSNTLAGRAAGINVTNTSGMAGASSSLRIRGSFAEPLYVIDGIVRDKAAFDALEANEVDQMSFLKDAATAAVYGTRAGNGVVVVTTKKGTAQEPVFNVQSNYNFGAPTQTLLADITTAADELTYQNRVSQFLWENGSRSQPWVAPNGQEEFDYFKDKVYSVNDVIWRNPFSHRQSISVSGGGDRITYYNLVSYRKENGSYKSLNHEKFNLRSNVSAKITDDFTIDVNISANQINSQRFYWPFSTSSNDDDFDVSDFYRVTFNWPKMYPFYLNKDGSPSNTATEYPVQTPMGSWQAWNVIDQVVGNRYIDRKVRQVNPIMTLNYKLDKLIEGLSTKVVGSYLAEDYMRKRFMTFQKNYTFTSLNPDGNRFIPAPPSEDKVNIFTFSQAQPFMDYAPQREWEYQVNWFLNYNRRFNKHAIDALVVYEQFKAGGTYVTSRAENPIVSIDQMFIYPTDRTFRATDAYESINSRRGFIGRANYNYADKYIAEFSFRYDGSPLFPGDKRWGFFPSMSAAWRISEEQFFSDIKNTFSDLKLRASYGTTGNDLNVNAERIGQFLYQEKYRPAGGYMFGDRYYNGIAYGATPTQNLTWTTSKSINIGVDFGLINNKLTGVLDVFSRKETNILGPRSLKVPDNYGRELAPENYAARSYKGGEFSLNWNDRLGEVSYGLTANIGYAKDRWDIYDEEPAFAVGGTRNFESRVGRPENRIVGLEAIDLVRTQEQLDALKNQGFKTYGRDPYLGMILYKDIRGANYSDTPDGKIDDNDMMLLSDDNTPRINYGFGLNASWKGLSVSALLQGVMAYDRVISNQEGGGIRQHGGTFRPYYPIWAGDVWTAENPDAAYPRVVGSNWQESGTGVSSFWIRNGAYLRLRDLNISYSLPQSVTNAMKIKNVSVFFNGTNLFVFSPMTEFHDPEQKMYDSYPVMKTFALGLDVKF